MLTPKTVKSVFDKMTADLKAIRQKQKTKSVELAGQIKGLTLDKVAVDDELAMADRAITKIESLFTKGTE